MGKISKIFAFFATFAAIFSVSLLAQKAKDSPDKKTFPIPKVIQINDVKIKEILKPKGKPLLVNFWATWCVPCREEFPDLVEIDKEYKGKIDFITISLDDPAEINRDVPKFLNEMKATMPSYLLRTNDENAVIGSISKDWAGGLPFTVLYNEKGEIVHTRQGKIRVNIVKRKLNSLITDSIISKLDEDTQLKIKISREIRNSENPFQKGMEDAKNDIQKELVQYIRYGERIQARTESDKVLEKKYNIIFREFGCKMSVGLKQYIEGYNKIAKEEIRQRFNVEL